MSLKIIMYHYVRDLARSDFPRIKGRDLDEFKGQLDHFEAHYTIVTAEQVVAATKGDEKLPDNAVWLTFDDGYLDHYTNVFPLLHERGWQGSFFPTSRAALQGELLDVNMIHFILAARPNEEAVVADVKSFIEHRTGTDGIRDLAYYWGQYAKPTRFDDSSTAFVKRVLQQGLPDHLRGQLIARLFDKYVTSDRRSFAAELYMSAEQVKTMVRCGMHVGNHGATHNRLGLLSADRQAVEIDEALNFLRQMEIDPDDWVMCYPHGSHNETLHALLADRGCAVALTTRADVANIDTDNRFTLPRLDTNDLPVH